MPQAGRRPWHTGNCGNSGNSAAEISSHAAIFPEALTTREMFVEFGRAPFFTAAEFEAMG